MAAGKMETKTTARGLEPTTDPEEPEAEGVELHVGQAELGEPALEV